MPRQESAYFTAASSKVARLDRLRNATAPGYLASATVTIALTDTVTGTPLDGETWPLALTYVTGSEGRYEATLSEDIDVTIGQRIRATYTATHGLLSKVWVRDLLVVEG